MAAQLNYGDVYVTAAITFLATQALSGLLVRR